MSAHPLEWRFLGNFLHKMPKPYHGRKSNQAHICILLQKIKALSPVPTLHTTLSQIIELEEEDEPKLLTKTNKKQYIKVLFSFFRIDKINQRDEHHQEQRPIIRRYDRI